MNKNIRVEKNRNETRYSGESYRGLHVISFRDYLIEGYLESAFDTCACALSDCRQVFGIRFDLHLPADTADWPTDVISTFIGSFNAKIKHHVRKRGFPEDMGKVRFIRAKEQHDSVNPHYHFVVLLNGLVFRNSSEVYFGGWSIRRCIEEAWALALCMPVEEINGLARFLKNGDYQVDTNSPAFLQQFTNLFYRISYLTKEETKLYGDNSRYFECSRITELPYAYSLDEIILIHKNYFYQMSEQEFLFSEESLEYKWQASDRER